MSEEAAFLRTDRRALTRRCLVRLSVFQAAAWSRCFSIQSGPRGGIGLVGAGIDEQGAAFAADLTGSPECGQKNTPVMYYGG